MNKKYIILASTILVAVVAGIISMVIPLPEVIVDLQLAQMAVITALVAGTVTLLLSSLRDFRVQLRNAYIIVCVATLIFAASMAQYLFLALTNQFESWWITSYAYVTPLVLATALFYVGMRIIAKALGVRSILLNPFIVLLFAAVAGSIWGAAPQFLPSPSLPPDYDKTLSIDAFIATIWFCTALVVSKVKELMGRVYKGAFNWVYVWMLAGAFNIALYSSLQVLIPFEHWYYENNLHYLPDIIVSLVALAAAFYLSRLAVAEKDERVYNKVFARKADASSVDVILCLTGFASKSKDIDSVLDEMRIITSRHDGAAPYTEQEQSVFAQIFLKIEDYLISQEPVRQFERKELRSMIELRFKDSVNEPVFWTKIKQAAPVPSMPANPTTPAEQ